MNSSTFIENLPTTGNLLRMESRRFMTTVILIFALFFVLLVIYLVTNELRRSEDTVKSWLNKHQSALEQSLFLENTLGVDQLLQAGLDKKKGAGISSIAIFDNNKQRVTNTGNTAIVDIGVLDRTFQHSIIRGGLRYSGPLSFGGAKQGVITLHYDYDFSRIFSSSLVAFLLSLCFLGLVTLSSRKLINALGRGLLNPMDRLCSIIKSRPSDLHPIDVEDFKDSNKEIIRLLFEYNLLSQKINELSALEKHRAQLLAHSRVAAQVCHDIKSPLSALNVLLSLSDELPANKRDLLGQAVARITSISDDLLQQSRSSFSKDHFKYDNNHSSELCLNEILSQLVSEKRLEFRQHTKLELKFLASARSIRCPEHYNSLVRVISNLINNSVNAVGGAGTVHVLLGQASDQIEIQVKDAGPGIPQDILNQLTHQNRPLTVHSDDGPRTCFGLSGAISAIEEINGTIQIDSSSSGTTIRIFLPTRTQLEPLTAHPSQRGLDILATRKRLIMARGTRSESTFRSLQLKDSNTRTP